MATIEYRLYTLNSAGRISTAKVFESADDKEALEKAKAMVDGKPVELWRGPDFVGRLEP